MRQSVAPEARELCRAAAPANCSPTAHLGSYSLQFSTRWSFELPSSISASPIGMRSISGRLPSMMRSLIVTPEQLMQSPLDASVAGRGGGERARGGRQRSAQG
jgi:hypothetical protein